MKKFKRGLAFILALISISTPVMAVEFGDTELIASNGIVDFDYSSRPINVNDRVVVPLKYISEMFNALTSYDTTTETMKIRTVGGGTVEFTVGSKLYKSNGLEHEMDVETMSIDGVIYLPLRYALEALGYKVGWSNVNSNAYVDGEANSIQDYRSYAYGFNGDKELGRLIFRTKYDCGLQVLPGNQTKGTGNSLLEIYYNSTMDINNEYKTIMSDILKEQTLIKAEDVQECLDSGISKTEGELDYIYKETPSGMKVLKITSDRIKSDIQGVEVTNGGKVIDFERIGAITRKVEGVEKVYVPLIETSKLLGKTTDNIWLQKVEFESGEIVDVTNSSTYIVHGITYIEIEEFNNIFKSEIKSSIVQN